MLFSGKGIDGIGGFLMAAPLGAIALGKRIGLLTKACKMYD
jgi:hypothetical protein